MGLLRQSANTLASRMFITLVSIPTGMILARKLGPEGQGIYTSAITYPGLWAGFGLLGLDAAHLFFVSRDRRDLGPVVVNSGIVFLFMLAVLLPAYLLLIQPILGEKGAVLAPFLLVSSAVVPLMVGHHLMLGLFLGLGRVERYNTWIALSRVILLALLAVGLLFCGGRTRFAVASYAISLLLFLIASVLWLVRYLTAEDRGRLRFSPGLLGHSLTYGLKGHLGSILTQFTNRFDTVLIFRWLDAAALGYYAIAVGLAEKLSLLTTSVQFVLFPRIAAARREEADRITPMVCRNTFWWMAAGGLVMFGLGRFLIRLFYSSRFLPALQAFQVLLPGIVFLTFSGLLYSDFSGRNRRFLPTVAMFIAFLVNLGLNFLWIRRFGIVGAALASTVAYTTQSLIMAIFFWRVTGISPLRLIIPERRDLAMYKGLRDKIAARLPASRR